MSEKTSKLHAIGSWLLDRPWVRKVRGAVSPATREGLADEVGDQLYLLRSRIERTTPAAVPGVQALPRLAKGWRTMPRRVGAALTTRRALINAAACAAIVASGSFIGHELSASAPTAEPAMDWYYDLVTGEMFAAPAGQLAPIVPPAELVNRYAAAADESSPAAAATGVRAHMFACGGADDPQEPFVGFLERLTPEAQAVLSRPDPEPRNEREARAVEQGYQVARPTREGGWAVLQSAEGKAIVAEARGRCPSGALMRVAPGEEVRR